MPIPDDQLHRWQQRRAAQLTRVPWLRQELTRGHPARFVADEVLVRDDHHTAARQILTGLGHRSADIAGDQAVPGFHRLRVRGLDVAAAVRRIRSHAGSAAGLVAGPNHVFLSAPFEHGGPYGPPVPANAPQAGLHTPPDLSAVRVAVLDTGVWADSPLPPESYYANPGDFEALLDADSDGSLDSDVGHANFIAGVLLTRSANASVRIVKVLDTMGLGTEVDLANALLSLTDVDVVNLSLGGFTLDDQPPLALQTALDGLLSGHDRVAVAAAGNNGQADRAFWPAAFSAAGQLWSDQVIAVAAHDGQALCPWSNTGPWVTLAAPGQDVTSTYVNHQTFASGWAQWSGTSFATPYVAAAIAEQMSACGSVTVAAQHVRKLATAAVYGTYPGLP